MTLFANTSDEMVSEFTGTFSIFLVNKFEKDKQGEVELTLDD